MISIFKKPALSFPKVFSLTIIKTLILSGSVFFKKTAEAQNCSPRSHSAVIVMYHRFDGKHPSTSVTKALLRGHLQFFRSNGLSIVPLNRIVQALKRGGPLPKKTLAITIDDAYRSLYEIAHPLFVKQRIPYTVFVNTQAIDQSLKDYMTWGQLKEISRSGLAHLEAHGHSHSYMIRSMNPQQRERDIRTSVLRLYENTGRWPQYFAYPYGETSQQFIKELKNYRWNLQGRPFKFSAGFSTQSGPAGCSSNLFALPRFALNMRYGKINDLFRHKMMSRHLPLQNFSPKELALCKSRPRRHFSLTAQKLSLRGLNCFASNSGLKLQANKNQAKIILNSPWTKGLRQRLNCTLPDGQGRVFWLGKEFTLLDC